MKVNVKPVTRTWLPDGHDGEIRYTGCAEFLCVQVDSVSRKLNTGLTKEDEERLEKTLKLTPGTLSPYNTDYWGNYKNAIRIDKNGLILDTDNPKDEIIYLNLLAHTDVANSEEDFLNSPNAPMFKYVITSSDQEAKVKNDKNKIKKEAYKLFGKMSHNKMKDFLKLEGKRTGDDASLDFIESAVGDIVDNDPSHFLDVYNDPLFDSKVFILDCIYAKAIIKRGPKYLVNGGDSIGNSIEEAIAYIDDPMNQDVYLSLKAKVEVNTK